MSDNASIAIVVGSLFLFLAVVIVFSKYMDMKVDLACLEAAKVNPNIVCKR